MAALVLTITAGPVSQQGISPQATQARLPALTVTVACKATPERTHVKNNRGRAITIKTVGSIYRPYSYEPFRVEVRIGYREWVRGSTRPAGIHSVDDTFDHHIDELMANAPYGCSRERGR